MNQRPVAQTGTVKVDNALPAASVYAMRARQPSLFHRMEKARCNWMHAHMALPIVSRGAVLTPFVGLIACRINVSMF
jgi:hypothetical protein